MEQFLKTHKVTKHTQSEIDNRNSPITIKVIKFIIRKFLKKKPPGPDGSTGEFYQTLKKN